MILICICVGCAGCTVLYKYTGVKVDAGCYSDIRDTRQLPRTLQTFPSSSEKQIRLIGISNWTTKITVLHYFHAKQSRRAATRKNAMKYDHQDFINNPTKYALFKTAKVKNTIINTEATTQAGTIVGLQYLGTSRNQLMRRQEPIYKLSTGDLCYAYNLSDFCL